MQDDGENSMVETILLSFISFVATNLDDMIINTFFFSLASGTKEIKSIVFGKVESYKNTIAKYKKAIVPLVYMLLGIYILN